MPRSDSSPKDGSRTIHSQASTRQCGKESPMKSIQVAFYARVSSDQQSEAKAWREADVANDMEPKLARSVCSQERRTATAISANKKEMEKHAMRLSGKRHVLFVRFLNG